MSLSDRRRFLSAAAKAALLAGVSPLLSRMTSAFPDALGVPAGASAEKIRGFDFEKLDSFITPTEQFFLRSHLEIPTLRPQTFQLKVGGWVQRPATWTLADLARLPRLEMPATFECSGSAVDGGMVSTGQWAGVSLNEVVERSKPKAGALEVVMEGADAGLDELVPVPVQFARSVPLEVLRGLPGMLVTGMNGKPLLPVHGYPLRVVLPGLYGLQNVKWVIRLTVVDRPYEGFYQTQRYVGLKRVPQGVKMEEILRQRVKSQVARIAPDASGRKGEYRITGAAWSGEGAIVKVEVSADGGGRWEPAEFSAAPNQHSWVLWSHRFSASPGAHEIVVRATDASGKSQPLQRDPVVLTGYVNNWCERRTLNVPA
jgi:DMSO/TMAO reductase YedYZ molybdopterin-dependent catalytic subunit